MSTAELRTREHSALTRARSQPGTRGHHKRSEHPEPTGTGHARAQTATARNGPPAGFWAADAPWWTLAPGPSAFVPGGVRESPLPRAHTSHQVRPGVCVDIECSD